LENNFYPLIPSQTTVVSPPGSPDRRPVFEGYSTWPLPSGGQREGYAWDEDVDTTGFDILAEAIASTQPETNTGRTTPVGISHSVTSASDITERRAVEMEITDRGSTGDLEVELGVVREMPTGAEQQPVSVESTRPSTPGPADYQQTGQAPIRNTLLPRCVPLHGLLHELHCTLCSHSVPLESHLPLPDDIIPCPSCQSHQEERIEKSARPRSIGTLRASVVLYGEEHRHGEAIGAVVEKDIRGNKDDGKVDLLIVAGTTLHIPGVKRMIKEFARVLKSKPLPKKGGQKGKRKPIDGEDAVEVDDEDHDFPVRTIFLNMDPPGKGKGGEWADIFDVWVQGNLQDFVQEWVDKPRRSSRQVEKRQIVLSPFTQIAMPFATFARASSISVRKTGDLTLTLAVKREDKTVALPRKRKAVDEEPIIPQTPPKSSRGRPVKSSAKVLSAKKRQKTQPSTAAPKADSKPPRTPVKTLTIKSSTREPRNSMRRYIREDSPCAYMSDESSSSLSSAPPSSDGEDGEDVSGTPFRHSHVAPDGHYPRSNLAQQSLRRYGQLVQQAALSTSPQGDYRCFLQPHPGSRTSQAALSTPPQGDYRCFLQPHPGSRTSSLTPISSPDYARSPYPATSTRQYGGGEHQGVVIAPPSGVNSRYWEDPSQYTRQRQSREQPQAMLNFPTMKRGSIGSSKMTGGRDMPYL
jgi:NAD-dependent SIR2 family protein deacetylase